MGWSSVKWLLVYTPVLFKFFEGCSRRGIMGLYPTDNTPERHGIVIPTLLVGLICFYEV